ncbi:MAG: TolC family protein [Bacteroidales bacterium]|nr:TolC family protein [Bacteroidales bacterium]
MCAQQTGLRREQPLAERVITLEECIAIAQELSAEVKHAQSNLLDATYQYKLYRKSFLPTFAFSGNLPVFNRSISKITMPDGTETFVGQSLGNYSAALSLTQPIPFMGGQLFVSSGLQRLDIYGENAVTSYLANVVNIGLRQPVSLYNEYKWQMKIEPVQYREAKRVYVEALENVSVQTIELYFSLLETQVSLDLSLQNKANSDTLLRIAQERFNVGKIAEDELLQVEVNNMNLILEIEELQNTLQEKRQTLVDFLSVPSAIAATALPDALFVLSVPTVLSVKNIDVTRAYEQAVENGSMETAHQRRLLEARSEVAKSRANNGFSIDLYATFGLSKNDALLRNAYRSPLDQEQLTVGINIPILDWGITRMRRKRAEAKLQDLSLTVEQEQQDFKRKVISMVNQYNIVQTQLQTVEKTKALSAKRYDMAKERFTVGKIDFLDYSVAQNEKDRSQIDYIQALQKHWQKYYEIRKVTLFDFEQNKKVHLAD